MYRRPMSPYNSRVNTYLEALERDEAINTLRREYSHHRSVEAEYDDLTYEITKAERENKKLEQKNVEIQEEYMSKIKANKDLITELSTQIQQLEHKIKNTNNGVNSKQDANQELIEQIKQAKIRINQCESQNARLQKHLQSQDALICQLNQCLDGFLAKKKEIQSRNKAESENIDAQFALYRQLQETTQAEQQINLQLRDQLSTLKAKKAKLQLKAEQGQQKIKDLKKKFQNCSIETEKLSIRCHEVEKQSTKVYAEALTLKENIEQSLTKNKDHTAKLKTLEVVLKENINGLYVKHSIKEKLSVELTDLTKDIEKAFALIKALDQQIQGQEASNKGLIQNLKKSIQSDQEAVKALTRKAAILNLIAQS